MNESVLRNANFTRHLLGSNISLLGTWVQRLAIGWLTWELTRSELWVGAVSFLLFFPIVIVGPIAGVFSDRLDPRKATIACNVVLAWLSLLLWLLVWLESIDIAILCLMAVLIGIVSSIYQPVRLKLIPALVTKDQLNRAIALNSISFNIARFVGPAVAGITISQLGVSSAFLINTLLTLPFIIVLFYIKTREQAARAQQTVNLFAEFLSGLDYVRNHKDIAWFLYLSAISCIFGRAMFELLPVYADLIFNGGSGMLAILTSAGGVGAIAAGGALSLYQRNSVLLTHTRLATLLTGAMICAFIAPLPVWISIGVVAIVSFLNTITGVGIQSLLQQDIDDNFRGRVMSIWSAVSFGGVAVGGLAMGAAAEQFGLAITTIGWGVICCALTALLLSRTRRRARVSPSVD